MPNNKQWTEDEIQTLKRGYYAGKQPATISADLNGSRTNQAISGKIAAMKKKKELTQRAQVTKKASNPPKAHTIVRQQLVGALLQQAKETQKQFDSLEGEEEEENLDEQTDQQEAEEEDQAPELEETPKAKKMKTEHVVKSETPGKKKKNCRT
jgi:hypothetical protein